MTNNDYPDALPAQYKLHWYVLERVLGQGGFGITYLARDTNLDQAVAIKEYLPVEVATRRGDSTVRSRTDDQAERYRWGLDRFIREARTLARFDHANIVRVHSVFEFNSTAYMVMRFEEGETLGALLERRQSLGESEITRILMPVLDGLELVHAAGFIHRDIKPDNILIRTDGSPVLLDFGSARHALGSSHTVTILVAPGYAPFEQYYSSGEDQGPWTDIYGLGATCYRAIAGRAPLDAIARSKGILGSTKEMLLPAKVVGNGRYSETLLDAVDLALQFAEKDRPQSIAQWRERLAGAPSASAAQSPERSAARSPSPQLAAPQPAARSPVSGALVGAVLGGAAVIGALFLVPGLNPLEKKASESTAPAVAQAPPRDPGVEQLRSEIAALRKEQDEAQRRVTEALRRPEPEPAPAQVPPKVVKAATETRREPQVAKPQPVASVARPAPAVAAEKPAAADKLPETTPPVVATAAPPSPAEQLANADRAYARGNAAEAAALLRPLAEKNEPRAQLRLGDLHLQGEGVERSDLEALRLFRRAAEAGNGDAQLRLGDMYAKGRGVPLNNFQAYVWYSLAARAGNSTAKGSQERMGLQLQAAEVQQAQRLVDTMSRAAR